MIEPKEIEAARAWRLRHNLTLQELADLTGYTFGSIGHFERGVSGSAPVTARSWQRFKQACELADLKLRYPQLKDQPFNW